ncbi:PhzF family phenazine biosynthesis isomerase [Paracoccus limosus]|uniref:PhzF family phenazine biosynthesis isomerase n=1 Tax=Paracoccus limosus TaxID=913252 RepID=A0A844H5C2_9RHOB|nr:PhzF family phenazine biosynthesis protein [Paracoccus limosus]MTH36189.1 PhzF family phenazine biosynthesis isomerase [Paracoccus limosus]
MPLALQMVDVFGAAPLSGNPLAVILGAEEMSTERMQQLTRWFNLSETAFLLPPRDPRADYRVRIFTLDREMPFAGHPTLGSCHAWLTAGGQPRNATEIVQDCGAGLVPIRRTPGGLAFAAPPLIRSGAPTPQELDAAQRLLQIEPGEIMDAAWIDNGPGWLGIRLASAERVLALEPLRSWTGRIDVGVVGPCAPGSETAFELRAFFSDPQGGIVEDPVTGSLNASVAQWLYATGLVTDDYVAAQGTRLGRLGRIHLSRDPAGQIWVGGATRSHVAGQVLNL